MLSLDADSRSAYENARGMKPTAAAGAAAAWKRHARRA